METISTLAYLAAAVCFILALRGLSSPESAREGNLFGIAGMVIAILTTLAQPIVASYLVIIAGIAIGGAIRSREDVVKALDSICEYYRQVEPGSPVPLILRRARKMAKMDFVQAMQELALATPDQMRPSLGSIVDELLATAAAAAAPPA